jgi:hypothetical protein
LWVPLGGTRRYKGCPTPICGHTSTVECW